MNAHVTSVAQLGGPGDVAILDHYVSVDNDDPATHCTQLRQLLDRVKPDGSQKLGTIFVPPKYLSDPIQLTRDGANAYCIDVPSNVSIVGAGRGSAFLMPAGLTQTVRAFRVQGRSHVRISGIAVDGNRANSPSNVEHNHCIHVFDSDDVAVTNCYLHDATGDGVSVSGSTTKSSNVRIDGCTIEDNTRNGITVEQVDHLKLTRNAIRKPTGSTGSAIDFEPFENVACADAYIAGNTLSQVDAIGNLVTLAGKSSTYPYRNIRFVDNDLTNGRINVINAERVRVAGNQGSIQQIQCNAYSRDVRIVGNALETYQTDSAGIYLVFSLSEWPERVVIANNALTCSGGNNGVFARGASRVKVIGNDITGVGTSTAIRLEATRDMDRIVVANNDAQNWAQAFLATPSGTNRVRGLVLGGNVADTLTSATEPAFELHTASTLGSDFRIGGNVARNVTSGTVFGKYSGDTIAAWDQA